MTDPYDYGGTAMCPDCVGDPDIQAFIRAHLVANECSFCRRRRPRRAIAADADEVVDYIEECLGSEYEDAAEKVMYISAEGGYQANTLTSWELLCEVGFEPTNDDAHEYVARHLPDYAWVQRDFYGLHPYDVLRHGWETFSDAVKHRTRYLFFKRRRVEPWEDETIPPADMLSALGHLVREFDLVRRLPAGQRLFRVREHERAESFTALTDLGPPPLTAARYANRMSPAGVSMLYAAEDERTAVAETIDASSTKPAYTVATIELKRNVPIVDLVQLPENPGIFAQGTTREERANLNFIHAFARDVSRPIVRDGMEHIEYVPTQVVTEYLRYRFRGPAKERVFGIRYKSAKRGAGVNVALFVGHDDLVPGPFVTTPHPVGLTLVKTRKSARRKVGPPPPPPSGIAP